MLDGMWQFMLVGSFGAVGLALALGTVAAMVRHRRTGQWPGADSERASTEVTRGRLVSLWARVVVGLAVAAWATISLSQAGLLRL